MRITRAEYEEILRRQAAQRNTIRRNDPTPAAGLPATDPEPAEGLPLVQAVSGKAKSHGRFKIVFHIYAVRPADWDGYHIKELQDLVVQSGILPDDDWKTLRGEVIPHKVSRKQDEGTRIEIHEL